MRFFLKKVVDMSMCLLSQFGCLHCDKEHSLSEFHRQYRVCGEIGSGGFGRVYKAYRLSDGLPVAVKCIRHKRVSNWTLVERWMIPTEICFMEECQDVQGVIRLICWFTSRHGFLIVMERPANFMDLFDLISTFGWLDEEVARGIFSQIVETVAELYKQHSVIHRDIKDENVVVDLDTGTVWLVDFGAAGLLERAKKQRFQGTLSYSPPEVFKRKCYYPLEGTVWSLGILLYILVVGNPPFRGELQICTGKLRFPRNVSSECRALIRRCLCPTAESRMSLEELQQHAWISCKTTTSFFTNFETEWRRRKRDSLKSDCHRGELSDDDDDDEDCSYRTEAGAEPGPLTIPMICTAPVTQRSPTLSSFVEHHQNNNNNNSPSSVVEESAVLDEYDERPRHESAEMCSSFPSLLSSETETGFETAPEYDDWRYEGGRLGFSSLSQCCTSTGDDLLDGCAFVQQNFIYAQQKCTDDDNDDDQHQQQRKTSVANSLPSFGHPIHRVGFRATQSDRGSARSSSSDSKGRRSNSFTSDDSFTSSTTYFSANSHNIPLPEWSSTSSSCVIGAVCLSNSNSNIERLNDDEDELTLRAEIPRQIVLKEERRRSAVSAKDEEEDEWDDDTIRLDIPNSCAAAKCQNNVTKKTGDESPSASSSSRVIEQHQQMNKWQIEKQHLTPHIMKQLFKSDALVGVEDGQQQGNYYSARRKGGDRYRRRKGTHMLLLDGVGRPFDRRRRRMTSPPQQLNMFSFVNNM